MFENVHGERHLRAKLVSPIAMAGRRCKNNSTTENFLNCLIMFDSIHVYFYHFFFHVTTPALKFAPSCHCRRELFPNEFAFVEKTRKICFNFSTSQSLTAFQHAIRSPYFPCHEMCQNDEIRICTKLSISCTWRRTILWFRLKWVQIR